MLRFSDLDKKSTKKQVDTDDSIVEDLSQDVPADGLVVMGAAEGTQGLAVNTWTSPLVERTNSPDPSSADLMTASGIESSAQTNKTYTATFSGNHNRGTGIVTSWAQADNTPPGRCELGNDYAR